MPPSRSDDIMFAARGPCRQPDRVGMRDEMKQPYAPLLLAAQEADKELEHAATILGGRRRELVKAADKVLSACNRALAAWVAAVCPKVDYREVWIDD